MPNNTIINLSKIKNNEMCIYVLISLVVIAIIYIPKQKKLLNLFNNGNISTLMISLACIALFMMLDNRIAVLCLVLVIVTYYESKKQNLNKEIEGFLLTAAEEKEAAATAAAATATTPPATTPPSTTPPATTPPATTPPATTPPATTPPAEVAAETNITMNSILDEQIKYKNNLNTIISKLSSKLEFPQYIQEPSCSSSFKNTSKLQENFLRDRIPEIVRENFPRNDIPSHSRKERGEIFKENEKVKNLTSLPTQNEIYSHNITGSALYNSSLNPLNTILNGPPVSRNNSYNQEQTKYVNTPFYPLNM